MDVDTTLYISVYALVSLIFIKRHQIPDCKKLSFFLTLTLLFLSKTTHGFNFFARVCKIRPDRT